MEGNKLMVGAGREPIPYTDEMFPNFREEYTHVHDESYVQVLFIKAGESFALVACGTVIVPEMGEMKRETAKILGIPETNVVVHSKHVLSTPHCGRSDADEFMDRAKRSGKELTRTEAEIYARRDALLTDALMSAAKEAAAKALVSVREARMGFALGYSETNVNRVIMTGDACLMGYNPDGLTDRSVPVLRFDDMSGKPIAILFNCNCAPGALENSFLSDGRRAVSGDIAAYAERFVDASYENVVSIYTTGATGDQWQALRAVNDTIDRQGRQTHTDLHEQGFLLSELLGTRLGEQVVKAAESIKTEPYSDEVKLDEAVYSYPGRSGPVKLPEKTVSSFENPGTPMSDAGVRVLRLGDVAVVFIGMEIGVRSYKYIKDNSPFSHTFIVEFASEYGAGYMVERDMYAFSCHQSNKSRFAAGGAEAFREDVVKLLKSLK